MAKRFLVLSDDPVGNTLGQYKFGDVQGYGVQEFDDLEETKRFCDDQRGRFRRLRVIDHAESRGRHTTIPIHYEVP